MAHQPDSGKISDSADITLSTYDSMKQLICVLIHGGATRDYLRVLWRGRWASTKSARHYIQSGRAVLSPLMCLSRWRALDKCLRAIFLFFLRLRSNTAVGVWELWLHSASCCGVCFRGVSVFSNKSDSLLGCCLRMASDGRHDFSQTAGFNNKASPL